MARPGRPSKGIRVEVKARVRPDIKAAIVAGARAEGISESDLLNRLIEAQLAQTPIARQEELPLQRTA